MLWCVKCVVHTMKQEVYCDIWW